MKSGLILFFLLLLAGSASSQYSLQLAFQNLPAFSSPLEMQSPPDASNRIFIVQQKGKIYFFQNDASVNTRKLFLDLSRVVSQDGGEVGLLGLAFHPDFKTNGYFYVNYTASPAGQLTSFISRFQANLSNLDTVINNTEQVLLTLSQPFANHNGGHLAFGNDGYLYASFGDGGAGGDPLKNGQSRTVLLGKILRIDVDHEDGGNHYAIPASNPYATGTQGFKKEIYAYGLRNTWKFSFDHTTGTLWAGDVGQGAYEEIDTIINGGNYGWNIMEGFHRYNGSTADTTQMILPLAEYSHSFGVSVTGGYAYRGSAIPSLIGKYIYGDYGSARIWALKTGVSPVEVQEIIPSGAVSGLAISSFGEDQDKNVYVVGLGNGRLYKIVSTEPNDILKPTIEIIPSSARSGLFHITVNDNRSGDKGIDSIVSRINTIFQPVNIFANCVSQYSFDIIAVDTFQSGMICLRVLDCNKNFIDTCIQYKAVQTAVRNSNSYSLSLDGNHPNPFSRNIAITYSTTEFGNVKLSLYDMLGKEVEKIFDSPQPQGKYTLDFNGSKLSAGNYILRLESSGKVVSKKIVKE